MNLGLKKVHIHNSLPVKLAAPLEPSPPPGRRGRKRDEYVWEGKTDDGRRREEGASGKSGTERERGVNLAELAEGGGGGGEGRGV